MPSCRALGGPWRSPLPYRNSGRHSRKFLKLKQLHFYAHESKLLKISIRITFVDLLKFSGFFKIPNEPLTGLPPPPREVELSRSRRLGLETVSRRTNISSRSCLDKNCQRLGLVSSRSREADVSCPRTIFGQIVEATKKISYQRRSEGDAGGGGRTATGGTCQGAANWRKL